MTTAVDAGGTLSRKGVLFCVLIVVVAVLAAYHNSFSGPFIFDDEAAILENPSIRQLWPPSKPLSPPRGHLTVTGRPLLNLSFAINYALGGTEVRGYHAVNLIVHVLGALTLFGVVRRTFLQPALRPRFGEASAALAASIACLWAVHPLQTESVTYVVQRAESLMGLFFLVTIYCFIRATESTAIRWRVFAVAACACGMATKEVMVSAPLMALFYDRAFVAGTFREAMRRRWRFYAALAGSWAVLAWLVATSGALGSEAAGLDADIGWPLYALTQCRAIVLYLRLAIWPDPLILDYGGPVVVGSVGEALPHAAIVGLLLAGTLAGLRLWPAASFAGCWFFGILAVTSSFLPLRETIFEHRMYLPLATVVALFAAGAYSWAGRKCLAAFGLIGVVLVLATARRNEDYRTDLAIWSDTVAKRPNNFRARQQLGYSLFRTGRVAEGMVQFRKALEINPGYVDARHNLAHSLYLSGKTEEAIVEYERVLAASPETELAHNNLAILLSKAGRTREAVAHFERSLAINSASVDALNNLSWVLATCADSSMRNGAEAVRLAERANSLTGGGDAIVLGTLAAAYAEAGRMEKAVETAKRGIDAAGTTAPEQAARLREQLRFYERGLPAGGEPR